MTKILIFGNSGSGKSSLARQLSEQQGLEHLDLDSLAWLPGDPPSRMPVESAQKALNAFDDEAPAWVIEGCYADLIELLMPLASEIIFLDLPVATCVNHAKNRPWEPHKYASAEEQDKNLPMLLDWIGEYPNRSGPLSYAAHKKLFADFPGQKTQIMNVDELANLPALQHSP